MSDSAQPYHHIVVFKFKQDATAEQIQAVVADLCALKKEFDGMVGFEHGRNISPEGLDQGCSHVFFMTFRSQSEFEYYLHHPKHKTFVDNLKPILDMPFVVDYVPTMA